MRSYVRACELAVAELSADEPVALRERGELPAWFRRALDEHAAAERARPDPASGSLPPLGTGSTAGERPLGRL